MLGLKLLCHWERNRERAEKNQFKEGTKKKLTWWYGWNNLTISRGEYCLDGHIDWKKTHFSTYWCIDYVWEIKVVGCSKYKKLWVQKLLKKTKELQQVISQSMSHTLESNNSMYYTILKAQQPKSIKLKLCCKDFKKLKNSNRLKCAVLFKVWIMSVAQSVKKQNSFKLGWVSGGYKDFSN